MGIIRSQDQWQTIFKDQVSSGSTIVDFCRQHQIPTATFYAYRKFIYGQHIVVSVA
jgi:hypothetical protein